MSEELQVTTAPNGAALEVKFSGTISQDADFSPVQLDGVESVAFDFEEVNRINSVGIRQWIQFIETIPETVNVSFERCPLRIINQINLFPGFTGNRRVDINSFYAQFKCKDCRKSHTTLLETRQHFNSDEIKAPMIPCPKCKKDMRFDGIAKKYFLFLRRMF